MRDNEFNQNMELEFHQIKEPKISSDQENNISVSEFSLCDEFRESDTEENSKNTYNKRNTDTKKKILNMMVAMVGTITVLSVTGIGNPFDYSQDNSIRSTKYNSMFEKIIELAENEDYTALAVLMGSKEMESCIETFSPEKYIQMKMDNHIHNNVIFMYNGEYATNSTTECFHTLYNEDDKNIFIQTSEYDNGTENFSKGSLYVSISPSLHMTEEYLTDAKETDVIAFRSFYPESTGDGNEILDIPLMIDFYSMTLTGYDMGKNYKSCVIDFDTNQGKCEKTYLCEVSSEKWNAGPKGGTTVYQNIHEDTLHKYDFVIGEDGHVVDGQCYYTSITKDVSESNATPTLMTGLMDGIEITQALEERYYKNHHNIFYRSFCLFSDIEND